MVAPWPFGPVNNERAYQIFRDNTEAKGNPRRVVIMKALVLSGGGMFGAYQAGAWKILADVFQPDLIVGASIGALNGWAIAGGCEPDELIRRWLHMEAVGSYRWKFPAGIFGGVLDTQHLQGLISDIYQCYPPRLDYA